VRQYRESDYCTIHINQDLLLLFEPERYSLLLRLFIVDDHCFDVPSQVRKDKKAKWFIVAYFLVIGYILASGPKQSRYGNHFFFLFMAWSSTV
jgi:hypothetical protein